MARKLRIQYQGAIYHVINRGNYRRDIFEDVRSAQAFESVLLEACENYGWRLHAHVVMRNHYHLAIETPRANLVDGMHWLQTTFATRFNRFRQERGHLFQGRYQAILIEDAVALARVVDYIHLNPVRAGVVTVEQLGAFRWSSLRRFLRGPRPKEFSAQAWLEAKGLTDTPDDWASYLRELTVLAADDAEQKARGLEGLSKGWAIGTDGWRRSLAKEHAHKALRPDMDAAQLADFKAAHWAQFVADELKRLGKSPADLAAAKHSAPWKIELAVRMRREGAPHPWIARELHMGQPSSVRTYLSLRRASCAAT